MILNEQNYQSSTPNTLQMALILFVFLIFILILFLWWCNILRCCLMNLSIFCKVQKESNSVCRFLFSSAENTVNRATKLAEPVTNVFEKPIKFADSTFCSTMDVVGNTIPKVIETPQKICSKAINVVPVQPAVKCVKKVGDYGKQTVNHIYSKVQGKNPAATPDTPTNQYENENETEQENYDLRRTKSYEDIYERKALKIKNRRHVIFNPKLRKWFDDADFFQSHMLTTESTDNSEMEYESSSAATTSTSTSTPLTSSIYSSTSNERESDSKKNKKGKQEEIYYKAFNQLDELEKEINNRDSNENDSFEEYVATELKKLSALDQVILKKDICNLIADIQIKRITEVNEITEMTDPQNKDGFVYVDDPQE